jgi:DNA ligase (NAD+)
MTKTEAEKRINKLKKMINHHRRQYHVFDKQDISDDAFDSLKHELYKLEQLFPQFITSDSPSQRVGGQPLKKFKKKKHQTLMLSLEDVFSRKELEDWQNYLQRLLPNEKLDYFCELKIDGFAVSLIYQKGFFVSGATRGDGLIGEEVTQNLKTIQSLPLVLRSYQNLPEKIEVRGEVYMEKQDFQKINQKLDNKYSNPRNLAAGSIRQLNPKIAASRPLKFMAYDLIGSINQLTHEQKHQSLSLIGFKVDKGKNCQNLSQVINYWQKAASQRDELSFQIDGIVVNVNQNNLFQKLGNVGKSPRAARALKFSPKQAVSQVQDIKIQVGRTGAVTPIALLKPVEIDGVIITRATLHNQNEINRLGLKINDTVIVERAGDVIPSVSKVLTELRTGKEKKFSFPRKCPYCSSQLFKPESEAVWRCLNEKCSARKRENIYHFISKKAFNIDGLGPKIIDKLIDHGLIFSLVDIFSLKKQDLIDLDNFGQKSAENLIQSINQSKEISLVKFIFSLGIRYLGEETAQDLADHFQTINKLRKASQQEIESINGLGPKASQSIYQWFKSENNQKLIDQLIENNVRIINPAKKLINNKLAGKTFILTGSLNAITREQAEQKIKLMAGKISQSVSSKTDYLIVGQEPGSKLAKAKKLGLKTIDEKQFLDLIK